ncbi:MAG: NifU family protein [Planctomycetes bacterium]|nr:NifU family protein [Planctomycetota bacterium]
MPTVTLTPIAKEKLDEYLKEEPAETVVRLLVEDDGKFGLSLDSATSGDSSFETQGIAFVIESTYAEVIEGLKIDYLVQGASSGFSLTGGKRPAKNRVLLRTEPTPNPDAMKFVLAFQRMDESKTWLADSEGQPKHVSALLAIPGVVQVFELADFVTVTRAPETPWDQILPAAKEIVEGLERPTSTAGAGGNYAEGSFEERLYSFIRSDVAPFLQADGGDIQLVGYTEGTVQVRLQGACGTCPSSIATLRGGVERRLKEEFPEEVKELELVPA